MSGGGNCCPCYSTCELRQPPLTRDPEHFQELDPCHPEHCKLHGKMDEFNPLDSRIFKAAKYGKEEDSLGSPIGVAASSYPFTSKMGNRAFIMQRYAAILKGFATVYLVPEPKWTSHTVDKIIAEGEMLYQDSGVTDDMFDNEYKDDCEDEYKEPAKLDSYLTDEALINRQFAMDSHRFSVAFGMDAMPPSKAEDEPQELMMYDLAETMRSFYRTAKFGLLLIKNHYFLIYRNRGVYFVLDVFGRSLRTLRTNYKKGHATLICLRTLDNVIHLLKEMSNFEPYDPFVLREIHMTRLTTPDGNTLTREYTLRKMDYEIVSWDYAFLASQLHLTLNRYDVLRSRSAFTVTLAVLLATKIDHPATWNRLMLDRVICYGVKLCKLCLMNCCNPETYVTMDNFPNQLKMGQFWITFRIYQDQFQGIWKCVPNITASDLERRICEAFGKGYDKLLLQLANQMYALFRKDKFYFFFDPYLHLVAGRIVEDNDLKRVASLRMFCTFETFMKTLTDCLLQNTTTTYFYLHIVRIRKINLNYVPMTPLEVAEFEFDEVEWDEVKSINQNICFDEDQIKCTEELGQLTDFEEQEQDIPSSEYDDETDDIDEEMDEEYYEESPSEEEEGED